jgi:protein-tyrosine phosphatase
MDHDHVADLKRDCPPHLLARIRLLMDFAENPVGRDVPDPYYGNAADFENVLDRVEVGCRGLLAALLEAPARPAQATPESSSDT